MKILIEFIILIMLVSGLQLFLLNYILPPKWIFRNRIWYQGFVQGILLMIMVSVLGLILNRISRDIIHLSIVYSIGIITMMLYYYLIFKIQYYKINKNTNFDKQMDEDEIMNDTGFINKKNEIINEEGITIKENERISGKLILTTKRLCFLCKDKDKTKFNIYFADSIQIPKLTKGLFISNGIFIKHKETEFKIYISFARYWVKEITKMINA